MILFVFFKQKTAYEMRISDWSSDVCSSDLNLNTLIDYRYQQHFRARRGNGGAGRQKTGADGSDVVLRVPPGTEILDEDRETVLADMTEPGQRVLLAKGGDGGFGNVHFKSSTNRAHRRAGPGWPGEERWIWLRLKLVADAGPVGMPNAGRSEEPTSELQSLILRLDTALCL